MEHSHSFVIDIPVPRVCAKESNIRIKDSQLQHRLRRVISRKSRKYSEEFKHALPLKQTISKKIKGDAVLLLYRLYIKGQDKIKHKRDLSVTIQQKYKMTVNEFRRRLQVKNPPDEVKAVTDIDEGYFNYVNGRPLVDRAPLFKTLKSVVTHQMRTMLEVGFRNDQILNFQANFRNEMKIYNQTLKALDKQTKNLESFISEDYRNSIALLKICEGFEQKLNRKLVELQLLADQQVTIVSNLIGLDYMYYLQQSYGRFLYYLSPPSWRASNRKFAHSMEIEIKGFDLGGGDEEAFNVIFDKMRNECLADLVSPALYFTKPEELLKLFEGIEKQLHNLLQYVTHLAPHLKQAKENFKVLKDAITYDTAYILNSIKSLEAVVNYNEERCKQLEIKFYKIVNGCFYESVGAPEVIELFLDLECCYQKLYLDEPMNLDIITLAKNVEAFYMHYCKSLDELLSDKTVIGNAVKQCEELERKKFNQAKHANRELLVFALLKKSLIRAFAPPAPRPGYKKDNKSKEPNLKLNKPKTSKKLMKRHSKQDASKMKDILSTSELEYLQLFTDWTCDEDPSKYLQILADSTDEIKHD
ncbi:coiled-coil domain-containing protein 38-like [Plodia interpunctella]|uniref:coiled-coil domain-containing protein 38-like n=1 Tax=Plodia interpunctella TaxID=58824 RepID=UPI002368147C|nr:coiled-coil domain-containing protein 38-like [Plodia interpunctella]